MTSLLRNVAPRWLRKARGQVACAIRAMQRGDHGAARWHLKMAWRCWVFRRVV